MSHDRLAYRIRNLPQQLAAARAKVRRLEAEALSYGFADLLDTNSSAIPTAREGRKSDPAAADFSTTLTTQGGGA